MARKVWRGREAALWLATESLTLEHGGEPLSRYEARLALDTGELHVLTWTKLFGSSRGRPQLRLSRSTRLAEGAEAGRVFSQATPTSAGPVSLHRGALNPSTRRSLLSPADLCLGSHGGRGLVCVQGFAEHDQVIARRPVVANARLLLVAALDIECARTVILWRRGGVDQQ